MHDPWTSVRLAEAIHDTKEWYMACVLNPALIGVRKRAIRAAYMRAWRKKRKLAKA